MISQPLGSVEDRLAVLYGDIDARWLYVNGTGHSYGITAQTQHTALPLEVAVDDPVHVQDV